jgi:iron complex outermembrane receptor protein
MSAAKLRSVVIGILACAPGIPAMAQESSAVLEEITVTAQRREQSLQQTPVAVSALTSDQLAEQGITSLQSVAKSVPNLMMQPISANPSAMQVGLRGGIEQTGGLIVSEPAVALYVDDVYRARLQGANMQLGDLERVEVLRGPQGTLYGRNSFSGAVKLVTRTPSSQDEWAEVSGGFGSFSEKRAAFSWGQGLSESLGASVSAMYRDQQDGYIENPARQENMGAERNVLVRGKLSFRNDPLKIDFTASYSKDDNDGWIPLAVSFVPPSVPMSAAQGLSSDQAVPRVGTDPYVTVYPQPSRGETETTTATLDVTRDFGAVSLRSITAWVDLNDYFRFDLAGGRITAPGVYATGFDRQSDASATQYTQELQLLGSAANDRLDWIVGAFWFREKADQALTDNLPMYFLPNLTPTILDTETESLAVYAQATWKFTDSLSGTVGIRRTEDDKQFLGSIQTGFGSPVPRTTVTQDRTFSATTPKLGLDWKINDDVFAYASFSRGFKAGGYNGLAVFNANAFRAVYEPQEVDAIEVGLKAEWAESRLRTNIAIFDNDISDLQQTGAVGGGSFAVQNVGDASVRGIEAEITWLPIDGLRIYANLGYSDAKYDRLVPTSRALLYGATHLPLLPEVTNQIGFSYERPLGAALRLRLGADAAGSSSYFTELQNIMKVEAYTRYDAYVGIGSADGRWTATLSGRNLTDELTYVSGVIDLLSTGTQALSALRPREWAVNVTYRFR